jgi:hypothetical protein
MKIANSATATTPPGPFSRTDLESHHSVGDYLLYGASWYVRLSAGENRFNTSWLFFSVLARLGRTSAVRGQGRVDVFWRAPYFVADPENPYEGERAD